MRNSWSIIYLTKDYQAFRAYFLESVGELQGIGPKRCGIGSVIKLTMAKQAYKKNDHIATWLNGVLQKFWQFWTECLSQNIFSLFPPGYKVHLQLLLLWSCGSFVLFSNAQS